MLATNNKKSKNKKARASQSGALPVSRPLALLDESLDELNASQSWEDTVQILCRVFGLPDMKTRGGLKKIHASFAEIQRNLEAAYDKYHDNEKVVGGIVEIWARMSVDGVLRDKLEDEGFIEKIIPALDKDSITPVALEALSTISHHSGWDVRRKIAEYSPTFLRLLEEIPEKQLLKERIVSILAHATGASLHSEAAGSPPIRQLQIPRLIGLVLNHVIRDPNSTRVCVTHALDLLADCAVRRASDVKEMPSLIDLFVACLHSEDVVTRSTCAAALIRITQLDAESTNDYRNPLSWMMVMQRGLPAPLTQVMNRYDRRACDTYMSIECSAEFREAMRKVAEDGDLISLGRTLATLIASTEYSIEDDGMLPRMTSKPLPFVMWRESLPYCAKALRGTGDQKDLDLANIIELKQLISNGRILDAVELAKQAISRNPQVAYFYYAISLAADHEQGLRACKKGLVAQETTPFLRTCLLWRAVEHAADLATTKIYATNPESSEFAEGIAFMTSAIEDAETFVKEIPPDSRHTVGMIHWHMLLTFILRGPLKDVAELKEDYLRLKTAKAFLEALGKPYRRSNIRLTVELAATRYHPAALEWADFLSRLDGPQKSNLDAQQRSENKAEDNLAAWLAGLHIDGEGEDHYHLTHAHATARASAVRLYRCSYCHNPSAALRRCGGCGDTRYCDASCQKIHWQKHKTACKEAQAAKSTSTQV